VVTPQHALLDQHVDISVVNLLPHAQITIVATCYDAYKKPWSSHAVFKADGTGAVHVATQAPLSGSYTSIDAMGLFWSMMPTDTDVAGHTMSKWTLNLCDITLSIFAHDKLLVQKKIHRLPVAPDIEKRIIREQGVVGTLFYPKNILKGPAVIVVPGSGGGIPENISQLFASHGYAVLALGYFGVECLPEQLSEIPLEYFQNVMHWLKQQPQVNAQKIALMGHSRGGELVLLLAATFPTEMAAVIAYGTPSLVYGDFAPHEKAAWTLKGQPVPFLPNLSESETLAATQAGHVPFHAGTLADPLEESATFLYAMKKFSNKIEAATIPVENITCPVLIISGDDDKLWPATLHGNRVLERLDTRGSTIERKHVHYLGAGHDICMFPHAPSIDLPVPFGPVWGLFGGTAEGNARAHKESWNETLNFLKKL